MTRIEQVDESWRSLQALQAWAQRQGFTNDQVGYAIDRVGSNLRDVARELKRHLLMAALRENRSGE